MSDWSRNRIEVGIESEEMKKIHIDNSIKMVGNAILFIIAPKWKQYYFLSIDECINVVYLYNGILFRHKKA